MIRLLLVPALMVSLVLPARAGDEVDPGSVSIGVAMLSLNKAYASVKVDDEEEWEQFFFEKDGKLLVVEGLDRTREHSLSLTPMEEDFKPEVLVFKPEDWKLKRISKAEHQWQVSKTIAFRKWKPGEKEELEKKALEAEEKAAAPKAAPEGGDGATAPAEEPEKVVVPEEPKPADTENQDKPDEVPSPGESETPKE